MNRIAMNVFLGSEVDALVADRALERICVYEEALPAARGAVRHHAPIMAAYHVAGPVLLDEAAALVSARNWCSPSARRRTSRS